jgi:hypothetical protein
MANRRLSLYDAVHFKHNVDTINQDFSYPAVHAGLVKNSALFGFHP